MAIILSGWCVIPALRVSSAQMALKDLTTTPVQRGPIVLLGQKWHSLVLLVPMVTVPEQQRLLIASPVRKTPSLIQKIKQLVVRVEAALSQMKVRQSAPVLVRTDISRCQMVRVTAWLDLCFMARRTRRQKTETVTWIVSLRFGNISLIPSLCSISMFLHFHRVFFDS